MKLEKRIELCDSMTPLESEIASYILIIKMRLRN